ncbi:MAG: hypothetical protein JETCAE03_34600 [Ignavibacteriaceae bacterium]|jgi:hypothetical protein|nr:MAG: hypothetical protein JETCAE03_34600 [Ignavibacteriaceae bacterium]
MKKEQKPIEIKAMSFFEVLDDVKKRAEESEKNFKKTGLCQANVEVSEDVWEPCKRKADPKFKNEHICQECFDNREKLLKEIADSQGHGDFFIKF